MGQDITWMGVRLGTILLGGKDLKPRRQDEKTEHIHCALHTLVVKNEFFSETSFFWKTI